MAEGSKIAKFYDDKSVFITGATGFMGKVIMLKPLVGLQEVFLGFGREAAEKYKCEEDLSSDQAKERLANKSEAGRTDVCQVI